MTIRWAAHIFAFLPLAVCAQNALENPALPEPFGEEMIGELDLTVIESSPAPSELTSGVMLANSLLEFNDFSEQAQATLGETIGWQPGITSSYYGQGASRPVVRGFDGFRVRMLRDSIGTLDVSSSSPDHGLPLEPLLMKEIEISRGPAALLYGNAALGGAVEVRSRGLVTERPYTPLSGALESRFDSVSDGWTSTAYINAVAGDWVFNVTHSLRTADDYRIAGRARTSLYDRTFNPVINPPVGPTEPIENPSGRLPNSDLRNEAFSVGLSWLPEDSDWMAAVALNRFDSEYGVPFFPGFDAADLFGDSRIVLEQERLDLRVAYAPDLPWLTEARFHFGYGDYQHEERFIGRAGGKDADKRFTDTRFNMESWEGRLDWFHQPTDALSGIFGFQFWGENMDPSFLARAPNPNSRFFNSFETRNLGFFLNESYRWSDFELSGTLRYEAQEILDQSSADIGFTEELDNSSFSAALGITWERDRVWELDRLKLSANASRIERLPTATERFAFWDNPAIQRFLIGGDLDGNPLETEVSTGIDLGMEAQIDDWTVSVNLFSYWIDDFVFLQDTTDGFGLQARYLAADALFFGYEAEVRWSILQSDDENLSLIFMSDGVRAQQRGSDEQPLPRIPPLRLGSRLEYDRGPLSAALELRYAFEQDRVQPGSALALPELPTDAYSEVNLELNYRWELKETLTLTSFIRVQNLLDSDRRHHTSFLKDVAPLPGRNITLGARLEF